MNKLLSRNMSPRILIPLIRTSCEQGTEEGRQKAWTTYRQMRELLGKDMTLTDYDQVISYFLTAHYMENALYAFVDMMSDGRIDLTRHSSPHPSSTPLLFSFICRADSLSLFASSLPLHDKPDFCAIHHNV
jgi:hypothetical protein